MKLIALVSAAVLSALTLAPRPAPAAQASEPVRLAFRFAAGASTRYRVNATEAISIRLRGAPPGVPGTILYTGGMVMGITQKVMSVAPDGSASLHVNVGDVKADFTLMDQQIVIRGANGRLSVTANGQPQSASLASDLERAMKSGIPMKVTNLGEVTAVRSPLGSMVGALPGEDLTRAFGGYGFSGMTLAPLPAEPVKPGDAWEAKKSAPGPNGDVVIEFRSNLQSVDQAKGRKIALITTHGSAKMMVPRSGDAGAAGVPVLLQDLKFDKLEQHFEGFARFDVDKGELVSGKTEVDLDVALTIGGLIPGAPAGQNMPATVSGKISVEVGPAPPPKPAPKKPATRKPPAKKPVRR
jgi:hypothetical protein